MTQYDVKNWDLLNGDMWAIASTCDELLAGESQGIHQGALPWLPSPVVLMAAWNMAVPEISEIW